MSNGKIYHTKNPNENGKNNHEEKGSVEQVKFHTKNNCFLYGLVLYLYYTKYSNKL